MNMNMDLVQRFCTPPSLPLTEYEGRAFTDAERIAFPFDGENLAGYCWGEGKTVLLVHGWGSRASHMAFLGRFLAKSGFRVVAYDAPAHSSTAAPLKKTTSNLFEYCHAISAVVQSLGPVYAVAGHSFGASCGAYTAAGISAFSDCKISVEKLVLMSTPPTLMDVYESFCRRDAVGLEGAAELKRKLETEFGFRSEEYTVKAALQKLSTSVLFVHDEKDEEFPVSDIYDLHESMPVARLFVTAGSGHQKILASRAAITRVKEFLLDN
jgi:pimeloyl-ACP methyl ester carboxylesterase